jgi:hypothetical protein
MTEIEKETGMTDAECEYWDDFFTKNPPKVDPSKNGGFAKKSLSIATHNPHLQNNTAQCAIAHEENKIEEPASLFTSPQTSP